MAFIIDRAKLQKMHKLMAENGYTQDYNTFEKKFTGDSNYANRKAVYDLFTKNGADLGGSYEEFMRKLQKPRATKPQQQPKTALGRAQQSVAQQKWGGYVSEEGRVKSEESYGAPTGQYGRKSELVRGLENADAAQRLQAPVSYAKPGAVKQMVKQTRERQHVVGQNVEQAGRRTMQPLREEEEKNRTPVVDTGNKNLNQYVVNTQGQMERQMMDSGREIADKRLGDYVSYNIRNEFDAAAKRGLEAESALSKASPFASMVAGKAYNDALDPDMLIKNLSKKAESDMANILSDPKVLEDIGVKAAAYGVDPEEYVNKIFAPGLQAKIAEEFEKSELSRNMPKSTAEYIIRGVNDSMIGTILSMSMMSKKQRQYAQQGMAMTDNGENPDVKPGMGARVARGTLSFVADAPVFGAAGKAGAAVAGKVFGNGVAQMARIANSTLGGRIARMAGSGMVSQGVTGVLYGSTNAAVQNYSTGDDTSIGNTVKLMAMGGLSEGASWATMGGIGGVVGAGIYNVSGVKRIPAKAFQLAMEGIGMHMGGNVAKTIEGHDTDWLSVEGNLEACANVVALKLTHARLPKRQSKDGVKESYLDMVARNINGLMTSDGQRAAFGGYTFTNEEKEQLFGSASAPKRTEALYGYDVHDNPLTRKESLTSWAMRAKKTAAKGKDEESYKDTDAEFVKTAYDEIMADNTIPWDTKAKFSALVMGTVPSARPMMENCRIEGNSVNEYSKNGELLSKNSFKSIDERNSIIYSLNLKREDQRLSNAYGAAQIKDEKTAQATLEAVAEANGMTAEQLKAAMDKQPLRRSEEEQNACVALRKAYEDEQFVPGTLHAEQSNTEGKDVVEENGLGTETPNNEAASEVLGDLTKAEDALQTAMDSNDVLKEEYERMQKAGMSNPQIYMELFNSGLTQEQLAPLADYINALSKSQGMFKGTQDKIVETTQKHVGQWSYKGELNGEKHNGEQMVFVKDDKGRVLIVGAGDVAFDGEGRVLEGDMLTVYDPATREMDFVHAKDVTLERTTSSEEYAKDYQRQLEELNSTVYAEMQQQDGKPNEASLSQTKPGEQPVGEEGNEALPGLSKPTKPVDEKEATPVGEEPVATFADGTPVPMMKDSKGRETADYSQMSPEQGAEWMSSQFGENAEAAVDGQIKRAEKTLKDAEKIKVDYTGDLNDAKEAEAQKKIAIEAAKAELELYTNIKKAMTEKKVKAGMEKVGSVGGVGEVGSVGSVGVAREKFESGLRVVGNKRTRTLADGSKLRGHYEIVEADSLTPSHNANDGYKKSEGFPVNEEGRTINDRDYENDKQAQLVTDMIAMKYDGQAVDQVPVVTSDGIVVDGNGRTMAGQKAAKNGTDSAYLEALNENAENYGFTAEQIEQSGIKHPRLVLVSDEPMKYDTATFAKFNKNEKKAQGNTQQAVANSKKLSTDEIGTIISEIEGSGSLDAFFNNPSAINSLLTRLVDKGVIGLNEVAGLREGEDKLSASGKDFVKNLLLGSVFSENTIRMMGADAMLKTKALNGIRAVTDNMKLGDYALMKEIDQAVQLLYEARQGGSGVDAYLRTPAMFGENAADRYDPISQAIALALEGKAEDFRELMMAYNRNAAPYADANQTEMFGERPTKEDFVNEFLKLRNWEDYETRHSSKEGNGDAGSSEGAEPQARGGSEPTEGEGLGSRGNTGQGENIDVRPAKKDSGTHVKNTEGESGNVGLGSTDKGSRNNEGQREVDKAEEEKSDKPHEASLSLTEPGEQPGEKSEGAKPVGDGKEPKANPLDGMRKAAELFKDEQITKARAELAEAKKSGDASEVKRLTDKLKGLMDSTLRGKGIGLVERRKIIGEELGKEEAEKIDKPWADMEFDEQVAETEKKPLDADEIKNSDCDGVDKANAVAYLNGDKNIINTLSYLTVYDNVRNRERDSVPSSGTEDGTQLDAADNAGGEGLGRTDSRPQGVDSGQLGGSEGDGNPERGESVQSGERVSGGESGKVHAATAVGERGGEQVHGGASRVEPVSTGGTKPRGSRGVRGTGRDVRERGNEGSGNFSDEKAGEATGGRGIDSRNLSTVEQIDKEISDTQSLVDDLFNSLFDGRTKGSIISDRTNASIIPLASDHLLGKLGINKQKMAVYKQLIPALTKLGYLHIKKGVVKLNDWIDAMKGSFGGHLTKLGLSDEEVYDYIKNMWNSNIEVDGVTHKLSEWASILGTERMKKEIATPNAEKYKRQVAAEPIKVKVGDMKNIEETLPYLLPQQQEDVLKAETQFFGKEHADREHAYGKGYMFTNGTGTGKTFTGLGIAKRLVKQGKGRILIVTPSQKKVSDWIKDGHNLNMEIRDLDSIAKERGTTATTESGEGVVITTFANFGVNKKLLETKWDAVIYDESHRIMENKNGAETARSMQHYMVTNRSENHCFLRLQETNKDYQKMKSLGERFDAERGKEVKRIQDEYKASHPSATPRDVAYATSRMLPKEIINFTPGDYASFPKLGEIHSEFKKAFSHYINEVMPKLEAQAKSEWKDTKTIFLSATPFNTRENLDYAEGYIFKYPEVEKGGRMSGRTQFYLDHFGAAYKFRYGRLEQSTRNPEAVAKQEIEFSDYLQDTLGTMSGRIIDSPYDYSRDFPTVSPDHAEEFNQAVQDAVRGHGVLADAYRKTIGDYNYGSALFETMKVANIIERIKAHLDAGRKVVIFHRRVETKEPLKPPFASMLEQANRSIALMKPGEEQKKAIQAVKDFRKKYADLLEWEQTLDYSMPREQIAKVFGKDKVLFFSGKERTKVKDKAVDTFNSDDSGKNIIVIQEASGKEGISLHDTTGKHQRVCITLALPQSPITALQIEGRTYRIGNKSNAIFEYPILGLNSEMMLFGEKFNNQVSTTENLALGSQARNLRDSFANGILEHSGVVPIDQQGVGGKEFDAPKDQSTDGFDNAVLDYYSNQKLNSRNREGVDYFPTPEPLGYKMMEWANMGEGDTVLEPSAGHGAIARYAPKGNQMVAIEPSQSLFTKLQLKAGGLGRKFQNTIFENYDIGNKHDVVVMNPPFGTAGATAIAHLGKAFKHLEEGGRVVALIPRGSTDKKFDKWIEGEKTAVMRAEVELPDIVFEQAGTKVVCRVVVVDKISNKAMRAKAGSVEKWDLGRHYDKIEDFFEDLRDVEMPDRIVDTNAIMMKKSKQTAKDLKELKNVRVDFNEGGINVKVRGDWKDYSIPFDMEGYSAEQKKKFLASTYETFEQQERQTGNETSQAVIAELKKLTCKLAGMTEEEMQRYLKKQSEGKGVMYRIEHAAEVYNKAKQHYRMELGNTFSDSKEHFDAVRDRAVEEKGIVMPNLNKEKVKVVEVEKHGFGSKERETLNNAKAWAIINLVTTGKQELPTMRDGTTYTISKKAIDKYLSESAVKKSENLDTHLSVLSKLKDVIHESIEAEIHPDYKKGEDGLRSVENGYGEGVLVHRLYGAVEIDGKTYRVKTTMQEFRGGEENKPHSYEVTKIELLDSPGKRENPDRPPSDASNNSIDNKIELPDTPGTAVLPDSSPLDMTPSNSKNITSEGSEKANESDSLPLNSATNGYISTAKLLQGVEKSYDSGKKLLDESKDLTDGETFFRKESDKSGYASLGLSKPTEPLVDGDAAPSVSERIGKAIDKAVEKTGGKVKMVNTVEEIGNDQVRRDIENGKQVTGWYDEKTGEVHLYMPNIHDAYTAEKTVWHETVGHKGMRGLLGDKFNDYMRGLWLDLDNPVNAELRAYVKERMAKDSMGFYDAIEEFIAESAEKGKGEPGFWNNIKNKVTDALHEIGYRISPNVKDVKYMLWLAKNVQKKGNDPWWKMRADAVKWKIEHENDFSITEENGMLYDNNGKKHGLLDLNKKDFDEATDGRVHYRTSPMAASKIEEYNRRLSTKWYAFRESTVDDMQSLQEAMQIISGVKDAYTDIPSAFNPLLCHNRMGSMVMQMCERYDRECTEPLGDAFKKVVSAMPGKDGAEQTRNANLYFIKKHGLERNRVLFVRDKIREKREVKSEESNSIDALEAAWNGEKSDLGQKLRSGQIDLREYYRQMDEWIVQNIDKDFKAEEHDYSGMHGIYDVKKGEEYDDANVIDEVMSTESQLGAELVKSFWDAKKKATDFTIDQEYANGFKDKNERDHLKEMFDWYVPLRKFDETVAEDVYGYISGGDTKNEIGSVIEKASGRESLSDVNVLAQISALAKSSIINGGKNVEKQHFMRFVEVYEKGDAKDRIFVEIKPWVEKHTVDGNEVWEEVMPNIPENSTQEQINEILNTFETTMKAKQAKGEAKIARRKSDIGYKFERSSDMNQHIVNVYVNGRVRRFVCQGNPRAAQAINGLLRDSGTRNWATEKSAKLNRICAQLNTSLNPDFISSNLMRDLTFASANLTKEGMGYTWDFCMEYAKNWGSMVRRKDGSFDGGYLGMFRRYKEGRLDTNNQKERWFKEFMDNGGETGFVSLKKYEDIIKEYENLVKTGNKDGDRWLMKKLKEGGALVELANEVVENVARYSTYCVSRKRGRSIGKSIYDAKEVSSNFNRHGSGDAVKSLKTEYDGKTNTAFRKSVGWFNSYMKNQTMFYNAGVQGANLFAKNIKHAPKTAAIAFGAMPFGLNIAVALLNQLLISQEDEKKRNGVKNPYAELPEWKRRNNLCIYWGAGNFKTIPMGIELRAFYGLGDIAAGYMVDESLKSDTPIGFDVIGQMAQLVPASDFLGHHSPSSGIKESLEDVALSLTPTVAKPELELAFNRNWTGRPIYRDKDYLDRAPRWKSAYDNTNDVYMTINKWANKTFNGIDDTNEDLKGSGMMADAADFFTAPYGLQHIVEGYTGGTGATIGRTYQTGKSLVNGVVSGIKDDKGFKEGFKKEWKNVDPNSIPFYRVFNYTPKEGNDMQRTKSKWYNYVNELEQLKYNMRQMKTNTSDVVMNIHNAATKYKFSKTKEGKMLRIYEAADKYITAKNKLLKRAKDQTVINSINEDINRKMQEAVADLDRISDD
nr:MAG TPA: Chromatin remodeling complex ATPase [Caudoviricetes sp.]